VEWVNLRVTGVGPIERPVLRPLPTRGAAACLAPTGSRPVYFDGSYLDTPVYRRPDLAPGDAVAGPAVIEEYGSTVPLHPGFTATVDALGNLVVTK
jgi:N-methylhydantoinase A